MSFPIYATSPLPCALVLLVLLAVFWARLPGGVRWAAIVIEVLLVAVMTPLGADTLARMLEARVPPARTCAAPVPTTIVVLAGVALWRRIPDARLVIVGGGGWRIREAVPMADLATRMGVPESSIEIEDRSRNTWENAQDVAALSPRVPRRIWLVSSGMHLPRALAAFRAWGFAPCAWPSDLPSARLQLWPGAFIPQGQSVQRAGVALHELIGGVEYAVRAWWHARRQRAQASQTR